MSLNMASPGLGSRRKGLSAADTAVGAGLDVANEVSLGALRKIPYVKEKLRRYETLNPNMQKISKLGGIGASIAAMGPIGRGAGMAVKAIAPRIARGLATASKAHPLISNIGKGVGYGTAYNTGQQIGHDQPVNLRSNIAGSLPGSVAGGVAGHGLGKMLGGMGSAGKFRNFKREIGPKNVRALSAGEDVLSQVNPRTIHSIKGDILNDYTGRGRAHLDRIRKGFEASQGKRLGQDITETLGKGGAPHYVARALRKTKPLVDKGYRDFHGLGAPAAGEELGEAISTQPHFRRANEGVLKSTGDFEKNLHPGVYAHPHSTRNLDLTKRRMQEQAGHPYMPGDLRKAHSKTAGLLNEYLTDRYPKYPNLMRAAQLKPKLGEAAQLGKDAFNIPSKDISKLEAAFTKNPNVPDLKRRYLETGLEKTAARKGAIDYLQGTLSHSKAKHGDLAWKNLANEDASKRLQTMFGTRKADELGRRARTSSQKVENLNTIVGGSQTAENLRAAEAKNRSNLGIIPAMINRPVTAVFGRGAQMAGKLLKEKTNFNPATKIGLMVNPRRYAKYAKKLEGKKPKYDVLAKVLKRSLRHPDVQKGSLKTAKRTIRGKDEWED
jgi:hypothetical protein